MWQVNSVDMVRKVELRDAKAITAIYNEYVLNSVISFDMRPVEEKEMEERIVSISAHHPYFVYEDEGEIAGFCYAHPWKDKEAYRYTMETTIYLSPNYLRKGIGTLLMERLIESCRVSGDHALIACITDGNEGSVTFHEKLGFKKVSHFKKVGQKFDRWLDVVDYELLLAD